VVLATVGVVLAAAYVLWMVQRVLYGEVAERNAALPDLSAREAWVLGPLAALAIFMGVASPAFTRTIEPSVDALVRDVRHRAAATVSANAAAAPSARGAADAAPAYAVPPSGEAGLAIPRSGEANLAIPRSGEARQR
jgi:NADH-quinone oxidoreductase subunit M